jgi:hypothetical protein
MPLSTPQERELLHSRDIVLRGYQRADGLYDIEAQLTDAKSYGFANHDRGYVQAGEPIHGMWLRLTVDEQRNIIACEAASDYTPYGICPTVTPNFARLAGLRIKPGFLKEAAKRIGGPHGCTHLRELLQQMATTAYQTTTRRARSGKRTPPVKQMYPAAISWTRASATRWEGRQPF